MREDEERQADPAELGTAFRLVVGRIARRLRQTHAVGELTLSERSVLSRLDQDGPTSPGMLAELERVRPQAMASTVAAVEDRGLVRRKPDTSDGRRVVLTLTAAGRKILADRRSESAQALADVLAAEFSAAERRKLAAVLPLLDRLADKL